MSHPVQLPGSSIATVDTFLTALEEACINPQSLTLYRSSASEYSRVPSEASTPISLVELREEAARVMEVAEKLFADHPQVIEAQQGRQLSAIRREINARLSVLQSLSRMRKNTRRTRRTAAIQSQPTTSFWNAETRVLYRETFQVARELKPKVKRLKRKAASSSSGEVSVTTKRLRATVRVPQTGEPVVLQEHLGGGAFKSVSRVQSVFSGQFGARAMSFYEDLESERLFMERFRGQEGVVQLLDVSQKDSSQIYMKYHGEPLATVMHLKIPARKILEAAVMLVRGLHAIHRQGYVHDDLHSGNILIDWDPAEEAISAVIADLGIMKRASTFGYYSPQENFSRLVCHLNHWWSYSGAEGDNPFSSLRLPLPIDTDSLEDYILREIETL